MKKVPIQTLNKYKKTISFLLIVVFFIFASLSAYSFLQPTTTTNQFNQNTSQLETTYDYKATVKPNLLNPNGGTTEVGDTLFKKITTAIPIDLSTTLNSDQPVRVEGTHHVRLLVKAGTLWEKEFPLEEKQSFQKEGTELSLIGQDYTIDFSQIKNFITQAEEELGVRPDRYSLEVAPNLEGIVSYNGTQRDIQLADMLSFEVSYDEITLASDKTYSDTISFAETETMTNTLPLFDQQVPVATVRLVTTILSLLLLVTIIYLYRDRLIGSRKPAATIAEKINKKYGNRIIPVSQKIDKAQKTSISLESIKAIIQIADEKELPIFCYNNQQEGGTVYFIVDGDYLFSYETSKAKLIRSVQQTEPGSDNAYAEG